MQGALTYNIENCLNIRDFVRGQEKKRARGVLARGVATFQPQ